MAWSRQTLYPSEQPQSSVFMQQEQDASKSLFQFILDSLGSSASVFTGLTATPGTGLTVAIADGAVYQYLPIDPTAWSVLPADTNSWMLQGLLRTAQTLTGFAAPTTSGDSINYLIQCQVQVTDSAVVNLPFSNGATPPVTVYEQKSPSRQNIIVLEVLAGTQATTGSQVTPTPTAGWIPLWQVTVAYGEAQIVSGNISLATNAPQFYGFVHTNPNGNTPVYLSPGTAQTGFINVTGDITGAEIITTAALFGGATATTNYDGTWKNGFAGDYLSLTSVGFTGSAQTTDSLDIAGSVGYTGTHAGTGLVPPPPSAPTLASSSGGSLGATTYYVTYIYTNASGKTTASAEASLAVAASHVLVVDSPPAQAGATGWIPCVSTSTGTETQQVTTPVAIGTNWTEPTSGLVSGAAMPASNTTGDPYPQSQVNASLLGGYPASAFALAEGNYVQLYSIAPTLGSGNAGVTGYFEIGAPQGTAPLIVTSSTLVANLNANYLGGFAAGNSSGDIPISNGTLNADLNAEYLNGLASSAFQPAGSYAVLNSTNSGYFTVTGVIGSTGGLGSTQVAMGYQSTNTYGINSGGAMPYVSGGFNPLALLSNSSVFTNAPLYVGGTGQAKNAYCQDIVPLGMLRSGFPAWRVTYVGSYSSSAAIISGLGTDYGEWPSLGGGIDYKGSSDIAETLDWRMVVTMASNLTVTMNLRFGVGGNGTSLAVYVDGVPVIGPVNGGNGVTSGSFTLTAGTHTIDVVYSSAIGASGTRALCLFPWFPMSSGLVSAAITSAVNG